MDGSRLGEPSPNAPPVAAPGFAPPPSASGSGSQRWQPVARPDSGPQPRASGSSSSWGAGPEPEEPLLGVILGDRYRVDEQIGAGGMGLVFKATHVLIGRKLAIKVLRRRYARQADVAQRFAQEARVASSIKHPNVVDIIDYGTTPQGGPYCVVEYLVGHSLAREIVEHGPLEPRRALSVAIHVARGLAAAHQAGVIHRDLKPDNVFLTPADAGAPEQVKILDFGIARIAGRKTRLTADGTVVGTPEYMSPEQARGDELDARSDLYALGVVLFEILTGRVPISGDSMVATLTKQVFELAPTLRQVDPRFAAFPSLEAALIRMLAKNRDERPASAIDAARVLQTAAANDLEPVEDPRERAALAGWSQPHPLPEPDRPRRSTITIGSGAITSAHAVVVADGPATGSFSTKQGGETPVPRRPSIIVADGSKGQIRPARILQVQPPSPPPAVSLTPTPARAHRALGKRPSGLERYLPLLLVGLGAAIFATLVTIGFVRWMQRREAKRANVTGMKGSPLDGRYVVRAHVAPLTATLCSATGTERCRGTGTRTSRTDPGEDLDATRRHDPGENAVG
jgi:eukaryotic-like serine/threonine-protein kinase